MNRLIFACVPLVLIGCGMVQELGSGTSSPKADGGGAPSLPGADGGVAAPSPHFSWLNPTPTGNDLRGIWGTADDDIWVVGAHGTVARWDGQKASLVYQGTGDEEL